MNQKASVGKGPQTSKGAQEPAGTPKRILLVDDHPGVRETVARIIGREPDLVVCGEAGNAEQAVAAIARLQPDLVLLDLALPGKSGLDLVKELRATGHRLKVLVASLNDPAIYGHVALRAGANGYFGKQGRPEDLIRAIREVLAGRLYLSHRAR